MSKTATAALGGFIALVLIITGMYTMAWLLERQDAAWLEVIYEPGPDDPLTPQIITALHEEARRITRGR